MTTDLTKDLIKDLIKKVRKESDAGYLACKNALLEANNDPEKAVDILQKQGLANAAKKASNIAAEGLVGIKVQGLKAVIIELNSQTDFVATNDKFKNLAEQIVNSAINTKDLEDLKRTKLSDEKTVADIIIENIAVIGENLNLRRMAILTVSKGIIASYIHNGVAANLGNIGVLVALESDMDHEKLQNFGKKIAMHIAAAQPISLNIDELDKKLVEREKEIAYEQSKNSGKPENVIEKMIEGKVRKFYEEVVLLEQISVLDNKTKISDFVKNMSKELGTEIKISGFVKFKVGEGIAQENKNFAEEVAAMAHKD